MTRTERAWQLFLEGWPRISESDAFELAKRFEAEAAKHEEPKADGEVWYAIGTTAGRGGFYVRDGSDSRIETEQLIEFQNDQHLKGQARDRYPPYFLVEVRRVN